MPNVSHSDHSLNYGVNGLLFRRRKLGMCPTNGAKGSFPFLYNARCIPPLMAPILACQKELKYISTEGTVKIPQTLKVCYFKTAETKATILNPKIYLMFTNFDVSLTIISRQSCLKKNS